MVEYYKFTIIRENFIFANSVAHGFKALAKYFDAKSFHKKTSCIMNFNVCEY